MLWQWEKLISLQTLVVGSHLNQVLPSQSLTLLPSHLHKLDLSSYEFDYISGWYTEQACIADSDISVLLLRCSSLEGLSIKIDMQSQYNDNYVRPTFFGTARQLTYQQLLLRSKLCRFVNLTDLLIESDSEICSKGSQMTRNGLITTMLNDLCDHKQGRPFNTISLIEHDSAVDTSKVAPRANTMYYLCHKELWGCCTDSHGHRKIRKIWLRAPLRSRDSCEGDQIGGGCWFDLRNWCRQPQNRCVGFVCCGGMNG